MRQRSWVLLTIGNRMPGRDALRSMLTDHRAAAVKATGLHHSFKRQTLEWVWINCALIHAFSTHHYRVATQAHSGLQKAAWQAQNDDEGVLRNERNLCNRFARREATAPEDGV